MTKHHLHSWVYDAIDPFGTGIFTVFIPGTGRCAGCGKIKKSKDKNIHRRWKEFTDSLSLKTIVQSNINDF